MYEFGHQLWKTQSILDIFLIQTTNIISGQRTSSESDDVPTSGPPWNAVKQLIDQLLGTRVAPSSRSPNERRSVCGPSCCRPRTLPDFRTRVARRMTSTCSHVHVTLLQHHMGELTVSAQATYTSTIRAPSCQIQTKITSGLHVFVSIIPGVTSWVQSPKSFWPSQKSPAETRHMHLLQVQSSKRHRRSL